MARFDRLGTVEDIFAWLGWLHQDMLDLVSQLPKTKYCTMTTTELRQLAKETLKGLPPEQLKVAVEFLRYLDEQASAEGRMADWRGLQRKY